MSVGVPSEDDQPGPLVNCFKCDRALGETSKMAAGELYHMECFICSMCGQQLVVYVVHNGKPCCTVCAHTSLEAQCAECGCWLFGRKSGGRAPIFALGRLYHSPCFQCTDCEKRIVGKFFVSNLDKVYCSDHPPEGTSEELKKECTTPAPMRPIEVDNIRTAPSYDEDPT